MARLSEVLPDWESLPKRLLAKRLTANHYISAKQTDYFLDGKPFASVRDFEVDFKGDSLTIRG